MKKLLLTLLVSLTLTACGNVTTEVSDKDSALISVGGTEITNEEVYTALIAQDAAGIVKQMATQVILNAEVEQTAEMIAEAQLELSNFQETMGENADVYLQYYGYKDMDDYYNNGILPTLQQDILVEKYLRDNYVEISNNYLPKMIRLIEVSDSDLADAALAAIQSGSDFTTVASQYTTSAYPGDEELVYTASDLPSVVLTWMNTQVSPTLSPILPDTDNATNYIVQITVADPNKIEDDVVSAFGFDTTFIEMALEDAFIRNGFTLYDKSIYDQFILSFPNYLAD